MPEPIDPAVRPLSPLAGMALALLIGGCLTAILAASLF